MRTCSLVELKWFDWIFFVMFFITSKDTNVYTYRETQTSASTMCAVVWDLQYQILFLCLSVCYQSGNISLCSAPCPQGHPLGGGQTECAVLGNFRVYFCTHGDFWIHCLKVYLSHSSSIGAGWPLQWYGLLLRHLLPHWLQAAPCWDNHCWFGQGRRCSNSTCSWILNRPKRGCQGSRTQD